MRALRSKKAFTLIELLISISILSIMMIFLYKSYASINMSNKFYSGVLDTLDTQQIKKKVIFLDFSLALVDSAKILNQEKNEDVVYFQSSNSIHKRYNPYIAYIVNDSKLYRLESLSEFKGYPLNQDIEFDVDYLGEVDGFRVYTSKNKISELFLVHVDFKDGEDILLKIRSLNEK